jgi:hypothetical protein
MKLNNYIPVGYENHEIFKGLIIPRGNETFCQSFNCQGLNCDQNCIFGNKKMLELYFKLKQRKEKLKKLNESI